MRAAPSPIYINNCESIHNQHNQHYLNNQGTRHLFGTSTNHGTQASPTGLGCRFPEAEIWSTLCIVVVVAVESQGKIGVRAHSGLGCFSATHPSHCVGETRKLSKKLAMVTHVYNPSTRKAEAGGL